METIIELNDRDNVIVTHAEHRDSVDTDTCAQEYASLINNHMRADAVTVILLAIVDAIQKARPDEDKSDLIARAWNAINNLA